MKTKILTVVLSLIFLASGGAKLASLNFEIVAFTRWGYPLWFMYFIGAVEVAGGIGLLISRLSSLAASGLALMMVGAVATHIIQVEIGMLVVASIIFLLAIIRAWIGRQDICMMLGRK